MSTTPNNRSNTERWLETLGSRFVEVRCYVRGATTRSELTWADERHIDDPETLTTTVGMTLDRLGGRFAVWRCPDGHWQLYDHRKGSMTCYPSQEAAEMVAIVHGY